MVEPVPCSYCGHKPKVLSLTDARGKETWQVRHCDQHIACENCWGKVFTGFYEDDSYQTKAEAIAAWNKRVREEPQ